MLRVEGVRGADGRLAHCVAEGIGKGVQRAPAGAVAGDDLLDAKRPQALDGLGNDPLHHTAEVQPAHHAVDRNVGKRSRACRHTLTMPACEHAPKTISPRSRTCATSMRSSMSSGSGCQGAAGLVRERWSTRAFSTEVTRGISPRS